MRPAPPRGGVPEHERMDRERIGKYKIVGELGRGTMGEVYKAHDPVLNRYVALKTLSARVGPGEEALQRFQREAQAAALLSHPNIVTVHDFGEENGLLYMAMELLEGTDLRDAIDNDKLRRRSTRSSTSWTASSPRSTTPTPRASCTATSSPRTSTWARSRQVKIMDFGLARVGSSEMTQDGIVLGTPNYMSPEQALGDQVDGRSDLFSTGAVLYELLTGHKPFEADSTPSVLFQVVHREAPPVRRWAPDVPAGSSRWWSARSRRTARSASRPPARCGPRSPSRARRSHPRPRRKRRRFHGPGRRGPSRRPCLRTRPRACPRVLPPPPRRRCRRGCVSRHRRRRRPRRRCVPPRQRRRPARQDRSGARCCRHW